MAVIRLYRKFYKINSSRFTDLYNQINPSVINADVYLRNTPTLVEGDLTINKESDGIYYVDLNPVFYSYDNTYDLKWNVQYLANKPYKILTTTFKLNPINISTEIFTEIENQNIECEIGESKLIEVIIL